MKAFRRRAAVWLSTAATIAVVLIPWTETTPAVASSGNGLLAFFRNDTTATSEIATTNAIPFTTDTCNSGTLLTIDFSTAPSGCNSTNYTSFITGWILAPITGTVTFHAYADDGVRLDIGGQQVLWGTVDNNGSSATTGGIALVQGRVYPLSLWHHQNLGGSKLNLRWSYTGQSEVTVPQANLGTTAAQLLTTSQVESNCTIGSSSACPAYSPQEIQNLYGSSAGTGANGVYWLLVGGVPRQVYVIMDSDVDGGGYVLLMKGANNATTFNYNSTHWTNVNSTLNDSSGFLRRNDNQNEDAKYLPYNLMATSSLLAVFPELTRSYAGATYQGPASTTVFNRYGFYWNESISSFISPGNGDSAHTLFTLNTNRTETLESGTQVTVQRILVRRPGEAQWGQHTTDSAKSFFSTQTRVNWYGFNYRRGQWYLADNSSHPVRVRWGFGWNENALGDEGSNDASGGIGYFNDSTWSQAQFSAGDFVGCCVNRVGVANSGSNGSKGVKFEIYGKMPAPSAASPSNLVVSNQTTTGLTLSWTAASGATEYVVQHKKSSENWSNAQTIRVLRPGSSPSLTLSNLTGSTGLDFRVWTRSYTSARVLSTSSSSASASSATLSGAPTNLVLTSGATSVDLSWTAPSTDGAAITNYIIEHQLRGGSWTTFNRVASNATSATVTGLTANQIYRLRVSAVNAGGTSEPSVARSVFTAVGMQSFLDASDDVSYAGSGNTWTDLTGLSNSVTAVGSPTFDPSTKSFDLNGTNQHFTYGTNKFPFSGTANHTFNIMFSADTPASGFQVLFGRHNAGVSGSYHLAISNGTIYGQREATPWEVVGTSQIAAGTKYLASYVYNGTTLELFLNGRSQGSRTIGSISERDLIPLIGARLVNSLPDNRFDGKVFSVSIFNTALTSNQLTSLTQALETAPSAPTISQITPSSQQLSVAFTAGANTGTEITTYQYSTDGGSTWRDRASGSTASPLVITTTSANNQALVNGTAYDVRLRAVNTIAGAASATTVSTPIATLSNAANPTVVATTGSLKSITVNWTQVANASSYTLRLYSADGSTLLQTITGASGTSRAITTSDHALADNTAYQVSIQAIGTGAFTSSAESGKVSVTTRTGHTISYNANDATSGSVPSNQTKVQGANLTLASNTGTLARTGFTFSGWNTLANGLGTDYLAGATYSLDESDELFAKWTANTYTVSYDEKSGSTVSDGTFATGGSVTFPSNPSRAGFIFGGWSATDGGAVVSAPYSPGVTSNIILYAVWLAISPPTGVTATAGNQTVTVGWTAPANSGSQPPSAYRVEYSTTGTGSWTTADATISSSARTYQITGLTNNTAYYVRVAAVYSGVTGAYGYPWTLIFESTTPSREIVYSSTNGLTGNNDIVLDRTDFSRVRYYVGAKYASGDATRLFVDAHFDKTISNSADGGDSYTNLFRLQVPRPNGGTNSQFELHGNVSDLNVLTNSPNVTQGIGLSGRLEIWPWDYGQSPQSGLSGGTNSSSLFDDGDFWADGGVYGSFQLHNIGSGAQTIFAWNRHFDTLRPDIGFGNNTSGTHPDWTFARDQGGYTTRADFLFQSYANLSVTPVGSYTITLNRGANGTGSDQTLTKTHGQALTLPNSATANSYFTRTGYTVTGWTTTDGGSQTHALGGSFTTDSTTTLYPVWTGDTYTVTYTYNSADGGVRPTTSSFTVGGSAITLPTPTRTGHTFDGWYAEVGLSTLIGAAGANYSPSSSTTIYAKWITNALAPTISTQPIARARVSGEAVTFSVTASVTDGGALTYQWQKDGVNISGATSSSYSINSVVSGDAGTYRVIVTNTKSGTNTSTTSNGGKLVVAGTNYHFDAVSSSPGSAFAAGRSFRSSSAVLPSGSFTIEGWVRDKSTSTGQSPIFSQGSNNTNRLTLHVLGTTTRTLMLYGTTASITGTTAMAKDKWHHYAVTYDGTTLRLYLNGVLEGSVNDTLNLTGTFFIGENAYYTGTNSAHFFHGKQDQVKIWTGALSQSDVVASMYSYGNAGITDKNLRSLYDFNQQNSSTVTDVLGGFDLTANGNGTSTSWPSSSMNVTFDEQGGSAVTDTTFDFYTKIANPSTTTKANATFSGWSRTSNGSTVSFPYSFVPMESITLYGIWVVESYAITLNKGANGTGSNQTLTKTNGQALTLPDSATANTYFTRSGYSVTGWSTTDGGSQTHALGGSFTTDSATTLYPVWTGNTYTVTYAYNSADGGVRPATSTFTVGGSAIALPTPTRTGFTFDGWYAEVGLATLIGSAGANYSPSANTTIYAKWTPNTYTITFASGTAGSGANQTQTKTHAVDLTLPNSATANGWFTRSGQTIVGWSTTDGGNLAHALGGTFITNSATTLYPVWTCAAGADPVVSSGLVLRLDADNSCSTGTSGRWRDLSGNSRDMSWVNTPTLGTDYGKYYEFVRSSSHYGTLTSSGLSDFTSGFSATFWARFDATAGGGWERILDIGRGENNENIIVGREGTTNRLIVEFRRSNVETLECSSAVITDGQWAHFSITVNSSGNCVIYKNGTSQTLAVGLTRANPFMPNNIERTSNFIGDSNWGADAFFDGGIGDLAVYNRALTSSEVSTNYSSQLANPSSYTITLNRGANGTGSDQTLTKTHGQALTLPNSATANSYFTRTGYTVTGWTTTDGGSQTHALGGSFTTDAVTTLYPVWTGNTYTITYSSNGGSSVSNGSFTVGGSGITLPTVTRTGYTFAGWFEASDLSGSQLTSPYTPSQTRTIYAKWTANTYTVTYNYNNADGGVRPTTNTFTTGGSAITLPTPTRLGHVFGGWYAEVGLSTLIGAGGASYSPTADATIYAKWTNTLIVDLDATNASSYSGTGTVWSNIAPGSTPASATLDAAAMYSSQFGGVMNTSSGRKATTASHSLTLDNSVGFTMEVWVRFNRVDTSQGIASYDGGGKYINFYKAGNTGLRWEVSTSNSITDTTLVAANTWYHYVGTCKNNTATLYRNGVQAVAPTSRTCTTSQSAAFLVGNIQGIQMDGSVSLFRFYTSALTADEVSARFNATKSRTTYTVTYNYDSADGGNSTASATYATGDSAIVLPTPTKTNNTFAGWHSDSGKTVLVGNSGANYTPTGSSSSITLYAKWTSNSSTVTFNANDGSGSPATATQSINNGVATALTSNSFTRTGYTFAGWNTLANGTGTNYTNQQSVTLSGNLTLYAKWTADTYTVTYTYNSADGGTRPTTDTFTVGGSAITLPTPTRTGYTFGGWYAEVGLSTSIGSAGASYSPTSSVTIYAKWTANSNTVTFKSNFVGGANDSTQSIVTAVATGLTANAFTRAGYVFAGWNTLANGTGTNYTDGQSVTLTGALTLYAKWTAGTYTVTYNYNSATGGNSVASGTFTTGGANLVLPVPTRIGYTFAGWFDDSGFTGSALASSISTTTSKTIYAKWTAATFTVLYEYNGATGGNTTASNNYTTASTTITLPTPTRTGYTFAGWYEASNFSGSAVTTPYTTSQNRSLYAKWTAVNYTVTYNANLLVSGNTIAGTGSVPVNNNNYNIGQSFSVAANTGPLTRSGYTFAGWVTNEDGTGTAKNSGEAITFGAGNINLYPKWTANTYTISYNLNGGSGDLTTAPTTWTVGNSNVTLPSSGFTRTGYDFAGWSKTQSGSVINNSFNNIGNVTLYAAWTLKSIAYTFDKGTAAGQTVASWPSDSSANFGTTITLPTPGNTVTINSVTYQFFGWEYSGTTYQPGSTFTLSETSPNFVAQWVRLYDVRYAYAGGTHSVAGDTDDECVTGGLCLQNQDITLRTAPTRAGHNFIGWRVQDTNTTKAAGAAHRVISTGYLFYANWQAIDYDFSFNSSGGSESHASVTANIGQLVTMPNPGFRVGYTFAGWSPDNGTTKYTTGSTFTVGTASKAFVAYWTPNVYTVVYDWQGASGTPTPDASYTVGTGALTLPLIGDRTKDGYTFGGWSETPGGTAVTNFTPTANDVLYAIWNDGNYTLSYDGRGASAGSGQGSVNRGSSVTLPTPVRAGFVFNGWYDDATAGNKVGNGGASHTPGRSKTLYARWVQNSLHGVDPATLESAQEYTASDNTAVDTTLTHNPTNTSARIQVPSGALPNGTKVNVQYFKDTDRQSNLIPGNNSYFFSVLVSWLSGTGTSATVPNTAAGKPITVTLNNPSIKAGAMVYMVIGEQVTELGRATQDETVTVQLTQDPEIVVAATAPGNPASIVASSGDQEATVSWAAPSTNGGAQIVSYTVTASPGNASCTTSTTSCTVTGLTNGTAYTFSVVATNSVGSSSGANSLSITPALATYTVTFNANGGSNVSNGTFTSGGSVSEPTAPSRSGYTFDGWSTVQNSVASKVTFPYSPGVTNNITLYALWTQAQSNGGGGGSAPGPTSTPTPTPTVTPGPTAPPSQIGFKPTPPPTPVSETGPVGSIAGSTEKITVVADAPSEKIIATAGSWKLEIKPVVTEEVEKPVSEELELQLRVASKAEISGTGLQPNTTVEAWVFSTPRYLGTLKVGSDGSFASSLALPKDLLPGQHTLQIGSLNSQGRLVTISIPISIKGSVSVGTFRGFVAVFTKDLEGQELTAKIAGKWIRQNPVRKFKNFSYSRLVRLTGAGYDIAIDVYINKKFYKRYTTRTR
jgi:uncharacterized repeat protein (TIGR02543 family)